MTKPERIYPVKIRHKQAPTGLVGGIDRKIRKRRKVCSAILLFCLACIVLMIGVFVYGAY